MTHWPNALVLVRHGESAGNVARDAAERDDAGRIEIADRDMDVPLSDRGTRQAQALGQWLVAGDIETPDVAVTSPYRRAAATAELAVADLGIPLLLDERLREREFGVFDRLTRRGIEAQYPEEAIRRQDIGKFYYRPPGGESWCDVALRVRGALDSFSREYAGRRVFVVTHQVVILMFRYVLERMTEAEILDEGRRAELMNCSVTSYRFDEEPQLERYNAVMALEDASVPKTREADVQRAPR